MIFYLLFVEKRQEEAEEGHQKQEVDGVCCQGVGPCESGVHPGQSSAKFETRRVRYIWSDSAKTGT